MTFTEPVSGSQLPIIIAWKPTPEYVIVNLGVLVNPVFNVENLLGVDDDNSSGYLLHPASKILARHIYLVFASVYSPSCGYGLGTGSTAGFGDGRITEGTIRGLFHESMSGFCDG